MASQFLIPPPNVPMSGENGIVNTTWYLFFYALFNQVIATGGKIPLAPIDQINMVDMDAMTTDGLQSHRDTINTNVMTRLDMESADTDLIKTQRELVNALMLQSDSEIESSLRDLTSALMIGTFDLLPDSVPQAQPAVSVTIGSSPFTFTAPQNGTIFLAKNTSVSVSIIRQGVTYSTGMQIGPIPMRRLDKVVITYLSTGVPTASFFPN